MACKPEVEIGDYFQGMGRYSTVVLKAYWTKPSEGRAEGAAQPAFQDQEIPHSCILGPVMAVDNLHDQVAIQVPHPLHMEDLVWISVWTQYNRRNGVALMPCALMHECTRHSCLVQ